MGYEEMERTRVVLAGVQCLSGVTTWAENLRRHMANHPDYQVQLLHIGVERPKEYDLFADTVAEAREVIRSVAPVILTPNYVWDLYLAACDPGVSCLGLCHADTYKEYYLPLGWYEPTISQFIAVSPECAAQLKSHLPHRRQDITTLAYGVNVPSTLQRGYQTNPLRIMYAGRVTQPQKRVRDFIPLLAGLVESRTSFEFDLYGDGDELKPLQRALQEKLPSAVVRFHGRLPHSQLAAAWLSHDVFVQTSDFEGTSVSMLEAMAHGVTPVVTSASSGVVGVVSDGVNGFVTPVGDMTTMSGRLAMLARDRPLLESLGRRAHQTAQSYAMDSYCARFVEVLEKVSRSPRRLDSEACGGGFGGRHPLYRQEQTLQVLQAEIRRLRREDSQIGRRGLFRKMRDRLARSTSAPANLPPSRAAA
jgi:glycosyltransferase involved in cell wall biosynthesis